MRKSKLLKQIEEENKKAKFIGVNPFENMPIAYEKYPLAYKQLAFFIIKTKELINE